MRLLMLLLVLSLICSFLSDSKSRAKRLSLRAFEL